MEEKRLHLQNELNKLNEDEDKLMNKKSQMLDKVIQNKLNDNSSASNQDENLKLKYEIERLKLEKSDLEESLANMKKMLDKLITDKKVSATNNVNNKSDGANIEDDTSHYQIDGNESDSNNSEKIVAQINLVNRRLSNDYNDFDDEDEDQEIKDLVRHAKLKLKLKYYNERKTAQIGDLINSEDDENEEADDFSNENDDNEISFKKNVASDNIKHKEMFYLSSTTSNISDLNENKKFLLEKINKEKDALQIANELLDKYKQSLLKRRIKLDNAQNELKHDEKSISRLKQSNEKLKQLHVLEDRKLVFEKEALDLEQLGLNIKAGKRLIKQKKLQLNLLENNLFGNLKNISDDSDVANEDDDDIDDDYGYNSNENINSNASSNLNELILKLKSTGNDYGNINVRSYSLYLKNYRSLIIN